MNSTNTGSRVCHATSIFLVYFLEKLQQLSSMYKAGLIFITIILIITFPFTVILNALVIIAVKMKPRVRARKSNISLALLVLLALTDFMVGAFVQTTLIAVLLTLLQPRPYCVLLAFEYAICILAFSSLFHLAFVRGERFLAMKLSSAHPTLLTDERLLVASAAAWIVSVTVNLLLLVEQTATSHALNVLAFIAKAFIAFCHVTVCRETMKLERQLVSHHVPQEVRKQFQTNKKAFK